MKIFLISIEFLIGISLIVSILLHSAKGEGLGAIGGNAKMFSSQKGMESGLSKVTWVLTASFLGIALLLSIFFKS